MTSVVQVHTSQELTQNSVQQLIWKTMTIIYFIFFKEMNMNKYIFWGLWNIMTVTGFQ